MDLKRSVLLVEDDITMEPVWSQILKKLNFKCDLEWVTSEAAAERAIWEKKATGQYFDVVICDIFLSGSKTGIDLWRQFRDDPTEFVFVSGVSSEKFERLLLRENRRHPFIEKPLDPIQCLKVLTRALTSQHVAKPSVEPGVISHGS